MGFATNTDVPWTIPPDWTNGVQESLGWSTDILQASATAVTQHRSLRATPRRAFTFEVAARAQARRAADMLLAGHSGIWQLPIWPDVQWLGATLNGGVISIPCATAGYDFTAGGKALLYAGVDSWEIVSIDSVAPDHVVLTAATIAAYAPGSRLYPLRAARVRDDAQERLFNDNNSRRRLTFDLVESCDWPVLAGPTLYQGHLVLDVRPSEPTDPTSSYGRLAQTVDYGTSLPVVHDLPGLALRVQQSHWQLRGRAMHTWFRSMLYTLDGRRVPIWVPSFASDLQPVAAIAGSGAALSVEWAGYTQFGLGKPNRRDVRIELDDGSVFYRRVTNATIAGANETLTLDSALSASSIAPERVRQVSIMALSTLASDDVELDHATDADGLATATTGWQAVVPDV
ncbi:hypothetical protein EPN44_15925 [bacterium]|nr:MAG: hypothetical protein EPN44_15925 [bacterium]